MCCGQCTLYCSGFVFVQNEIGITTSVELDAGNLYVPYANYGNTTMTKYDLSVYVTSSIRLDAAKAWQIVLFSVVVLYI